MYIHVYMHVHIAYMYACVDILFLSFPCRHAGGGDGGDSDGGDGDGGDGDGDGGDGGDGDGDGGDDGGMILKLSME